MKINNLKHESSSAYPVVESNSTEPIIVIRNKACNFMFQLRRIGGSCEVADFSFPMCVSGNGIAPRSIGISRK